jgi:DNA-binding transcriptional regulator YiaG
MASTALHSLDSLLAPIHANPKRARRLRDKIVEAEVEHLAYSLNEIRVQLGVKQSEIAERLAVSPAAVSKLLKTVSTVGALQRVVEAMGGELEVNVRCGERRFPVSV